MSDHEHLVEIFEDTRSVYETDPDLIRSVQLMNMFTTIYPEDPSWQSACAPTGPAPTISVSPKRTFEAARRLVETYGEERVAVLNFASATNPGGGVTRGAKAQEESLCRCSTLYASLNLKRCWDKYYLYHRNNGDFRYSDACIYSPGVVVFKTDELFCETLPKEDWYSLNVITCAAPNLYYYPFSMSEKELFDLHVKRATQILSVAARHGVVALVLGAFGCGAFRNDPTVVAAAFKRAIAERGAAFSEIEFAIYCEPTQPSENYLAFADVFGG